MKYSCHSQIRETLISGRLRLARSHLSVRWSHELYGLALKRVYLPLSAGKLHSARLYGQTQRTTSSKMNATNKNMHVGKECTKPSRYIILCSLTKRHSDDRRRKIQVVTRVSLTQPPIRLHLTRLRSFLRPTGFITSTRDAT